MLQEPALDARARRAAKRIGMMARKSRRQISLDNLGGFMLIDPRMNIVIDGSRFELSADDVIARCAVD